MGESNIDKKPLIGVSILAVVLLVLGSLSNVVGYQSVKSTVNDSPLFIIRTKRATANEDNRVISSDYLGEGLNTIHFPLRDNRTAMIQKFLSRIRTMDDMTFNNLITKMICILHKSPTFYHVNTQELLVVLYQLKNSKKILLNKDIDFNYKTYGISDTSNTICDLLNLILAILVVLYLYLRVIIMTSLQSGDCYESLWATCLMNSNRHKYNI